MSAIVAWLRKVPVLGWIGLALVALALVAWRLVCCAVNAQRRAALAIQMLANRRRLEATECQAGLKAMDERAKARKLYEAHQTILEERWKRIQDRKGPSLADEINTLFKSREDAP